MASNLTAHQITQFKQALLSRSKILLEEIRQELLKYDNERYQELAGTVHDLEEESVADLLVDLELADIDRHVEEIRSIEAALLLIARGRYGLCIECQGPIELERLNINPAAERCLNCQNQYEKTHAGEAHSSL
jgi:RNA polymerase-binding protein DksA